MALVIYDVEGNALVSLSEVPVGCTGRVELMRSDYVMLKFTTDDFIEFGVGCYVSIGGKTYRTIERRTPSFNASTGGYDHAAQFDAWYMGWGNKAMRYSPTSSSPELSFNLTADIVRHCGVLEANIRNCGLETCSVVVYSDDIPLSGEHKPISYENVSILKAVNDIASAFECEWWVDGNTLFFGRCTTDVTVPMSLETNIASFTSSRSDAEYANRLYVFGGTRNIPKDYRSGDYDATDIVEAVVTRHLMLPSGTPYLDVREGLDPKEVVEKTVFFDDVYPKFECEVDTVTTYEADTEGNVVEGETELVTKTFYRFTYTGLTWSNDYLMDGETLTVHFTSGTLNGLEFGLQFNPEGLPETIEVEGEETVNPAAQVFEVVVNETYGTELPNDILHPTGGDTFFLTGWDASKMGNTGLVGAAERLLLEYGREYLAKLVNGASTYNITLFSGEENVHSMGDAVTLTINGVVQSLRIIGVETYLDIPWDRPRYVVGEGSTYSNINSLKKQVEGLAMSGGSFIGGEGNGSYLSKVSNDTAYGKITFSRKAFFKGGIESTDFSSGELGAGYQMGRYGATHDSYLEIDRLLVRKMAYFVELAVKRLSHVGGSIMVSPADLTISNVEVLDDVYRCYVDLTDGHSTINISEWEEGDLARCQTFNVTQATYYWRAVENVDYINGYVDLSITDCDRGSGIPKRGDVLVVVGNKTDSTRQNAIEISSTGSSSPSIKIYHGIDSYSLDEKDATSFEYDTTTGRMKMVVYGDMYVGDRRENTYIKYDQTNGLQIRANAISMKVTEQGQDVYKGIEEIIEAISQQGDGSFIVWRSETDDEPSSESEPESEWTTDEVRDEHVGDIYLNSEGLCWEYKYNPVSGYFWDIVSDQYLIESLRKVREKARCFAGVYGTNTPTSGEYSKNDLWVDATYSTTYTHDLLVCVHNGSWDNFSITDWALAANYSSEIQDALTAINTFKTDVQAQVDGKADSYYQATDPSESWTDLSTHVGDLWYNTNTKTSSVWGEDEDVTNPLGYKWFESSVDLEPFIHKYDGKASIFYAGKNGTHPTLPYNAHDFWITEDTVTINYQDGAKTYEAGTILVSLATRDEDSQYYATDWVDILKYTDGKALQMFINNEYRPFVQDISEQLDGVAESYITTSSTDPSTNWTSEEKANHKGDIWVQEDTGLSYYWTGARWIQSSISLSELTDKTDGKATIFVAQPNQKRTNADGEIIDDGYLYRVNDLWILSEDTTLNGTLYEEGTIMVATASNNTNTFNQAHWVKKDCYTNGMNEDDKEALLDAGIDIVNGKIIATSDSFKFQNRQGTEVAVFEEVGGKGYLRTDMIHADEIVTNKVVARDSDGNILSVYNGNGNGTIVYYYPDGSKMKEELFTYTTNATTGKDVISGMITRYYNPDGTIAWYVNQSGDVEKNLHYYWNILGDCGVATSPNLSSLASLVRASWSTKVPTANIKKLCQFYSDTYDPNMYAYNGLTCYGNHSGVTPDHSSVTGTEVTGYVTGSLDLEEDVFLDDSDNDVILTGYYFEHFNNGKSDSIEYFVATNGTVWNGQTHRQVNV